MLKTKKRNAGFTVTEVLMVMGIFAFMTAALYGTFTTARNSWLMGEALLTVQQKARINLYNMTRELRLAHLATVSSDQRSIEFDVPLDVDGDGFLDLIPGTSTIVFGAENNPGWKIKYQIDATNEQIHRQVLDDTKTVVSQNIVAKDINPDSTLTYFYAVNEDPEGKGDTNEAVYIWLRSEIDTIQGKTISPPIQITLGTRANLRN